ncbi:hypothetical protein CPB85DRAFT_1232431 [Mucidula mucida]|nr:hypothetical protein CPB85DRAFT_1232431 [Mucidula mucida]
MSGFNPSTDLVDLKGKVAIILRSSLAESTIGFATVRHLARAGAKVYLAARDEGRASQAIDELRSDSTVTGTIEWLDLYDDPEHCIAL